MFEDFSFDPPRSPSYSSDNSTLTRETSRSVSPCSEQSPFPRPGGMSVTDLAVQFGNQRLRRDAQICYDSCSAYAANDDDAGWELPPLGEEDTSTQLTRPPSAHRAHSPSRRVARQLSTRLLCSGSHQKDIESLVVQMLERDQCNVVGRPSSPGDEGYDSGDSPSHSRRSSVAASSRPRMDYRRASDLKTAGGCISKTVRVRKDTLALTRKRTSERSR
ncbi:hypothetical protein K431DRAFT_228373 [Polychaeton citri CBS 116435]|uniref:Uncharacterized protein n=1 Tax=Polychaeton citri CBS 116435 TaxID=1314669 RepID=A0A9P4UMI4_9PEZI|nr:hypothetical protein K431DRAFT_228373 [Polychaeton citri CBS 116435]